MNKVLLVIPAYNEEKNIEKVVDRIIRDFPRLDYIVVNDGSSWRRCFVRRRSCFPASRWCWAEI